MPSQHLSLPPSAATDMGERDRSFLQRAESARAVELATGAPSPTLILPAAPRAVLVELCSDQRLPLGALQRGGAGPLAPSYVVTGLWPGSAQLAPADTAEATLAPLRVDSRLRMRLTQGILHRLAVSAGDQVLVTVRDEVLAVFNVALIDRAASAFAKEIASHSKRIVSTSAS